MSGTNDRGTARSDQPGRLPSLEEQTPGLDTDVVAQTDADAQAFYRKNSDQLTEETVEDGQRGDQAALAEAAGLGVGADQGQPPAGDLRTVYENERQPGEAEPRGGQR